MHRILRLGILLTLLCLPLSARAQDPCVSKFLAEILIQAPPSIELHSYGEMLERTLAAKSFPPIQGPHLHLETIFPAQVVYDRKIEVDGKQIRIGRQRDALGRIHPYDYIVDTPPSWPLRDGAKATDSHFIQRALVDSKSGRETFDLHSYRKPKQIWERIQGKTRKVIDKYMEIGLLSPKEAKALTAKDSMKDLKRAIHFFVNDPKSDEPYGVIRLYDGTSWPSVPYGASSKAQPISISKDDAKLPLEIMFPEQDFRKGAKEVYELGRFFIQQGGEIERQTHDWLFSALGQHFANRYRGRPDLMRAAKILIVAPEERVGLYTRNILENGYGFQVIAGPDALKLPKGHKPLTVLETSVLEFVRDYYLASYYSLRRGDFAKLPDSEKKERIEKLDRFLKRHGLEFELQSLFSSSPANL